MSLQSEVLKGNISPTLAKLYNRNEANKPVVTSGPIWLLAVFVAFFSFMAGIILGSSFLDFRMRIFGVLLPLGLTIVLLCFMRTQETKGKHFIQDCRKLRQEFGIRNLGDLNARELKEIINNLLYVLAKVITRFQRDSPSDSLITIYRSDFGRAFDIAKKFGLTQETWEPYFKNTNASEAVTEETSSNGAPTFIPTTS
jgi:hypothetical protein